MKQYWARLSQLETPNLQWLQQLGPWLAAPSGSTDPEADPSSCPSGTGPKEKASLRGVPTDIFLGGFYLR